MKVRRRALSIPGTVLAVPFALSVLTLARPASADGPEVLVNEARTDHLGALGLSLDLGSGYRALFPYGNGAVCSASGSTSTCTGHVPVWSDLGVSFGVLRTLDLVADGRYGWESDFTGASHAEQLGLGFRYYPDPEGYAKMVAGMEVAFDFTNFATGPNASAKLASTDVALQPFGGLQVDFSREWGAYLDGGVTLGFVRWLRFQLDVFGGVQARFL